MERVPVDLKGKGKGKGSKFATNLTPEKTKPSSPWKQNTTPSRRGPSKATPTKKTATVTPMKRTVSKVTPSKAVPPKGTRSSPRLLERKLTSQDPSTSSPLTPSTPVQSTLNLARKATVAKRAIKYTDEEGNDGCHDNKDVAKEPPPKIGRDVKEPPSKIGRRESASSSVSRVSESPTEPKQVATPPVRQVATPLPLAAKCIAPRHQTTPKQEDRRSVTPKVSITPKSSITPKASITPKSSVPAISPSSGGQPKLNKTDSYIKYLNRGGPKNLGSKVIPEGSVVHF